MNKAKSIHLKIVITLYFLFLTTILGYWVARCHDNIYGAQIKPPKQDPLYAAAISATRMPAEDMIDTTLYPISPPATGDLIDVLCLKTKNIADTMAKNLRNRKLGYETWVFLRPQFDQWLDNFKGSEHMDTLLRLEQLLGLPPDTSCRKFVVLHVPYKLLFRPCPDRETGDSRCGLRFPDGVKAAEVAWFADQWGARLDNPDVSKGFPWTQLGYTYDWNPDNKKHIGMSEYVGPADMICSSDTVSYSISEYFRTRGKGK